MKKLFAIMFITLGISLFNFSQAQYTILHSFTNTTGVFPQYASLTLSGGVLYGMAEEGGIMGYGCIFKINTDGTGYKDIHDFNRINGAYPFGSLTLLRKKLYGVTTGAGVSYGNIFSIDTDGSRYTDLMEFNNTDGASPYGYLTSLGNMLYGMTSGGGINNVGVIFKIDTDGSSYKVLLNFTSITGSYGGGGLALSKKRLYGMKTSGGTYNKGTIFSIDTDGTRFEKLLDFDSANGKNPSGSLLLIGKSLYGMTYKGGQGVGLVFSIDTNGTNYKDLLNFDTANGWGPQGSLIASGNTLFGMTVAGGKGVNGYGNIFHIDTDGSHFVNMFYFNEVDGKYPFGDLTLSGNTLYGMTSGGGTADSGVIFSIDTDAIASVNNIKNNSNLLDVYPNPSGGVFTFQAKSDELIAKSTLEVYNELGQQVYANTIVHSSSFIVDLSSQPNGIYLYRVTSETGNLVGEGKLIIQK